MYTYVCMCAQDSGEKIKMEREVREREEDRMMFVIGMTKLPPVYPHRLPVEAKELKCTSLLSAARSCLILLPAFADPVALHCIFLSI